MVSTFGDACFLGSAAGQLARGFVVTDMAVIRPSLPTKGEHAAT
jgi:hypothetical protein